jgi:prepilin-type processing-associated H-X9-DG protein
MERFTRYARSWFVDGRVKQFVLEVHLSPSRAASQLRILARLLKMNYYLYARHYNWLHSNLVWADGHLLMNRIFLTYVYGGRLVDKERLPPRPTHAFWKATPSG